jgi:hypothetical protein
MRFVQLRHLLDRQPFRKRDLLRVDLAAHEHVDDVERRHRVIETILTRFQIAAVTVHQSAARNDPWIADDLRIAQARPISTLEAPCRTVTNCSVAS